MRTARWRSSRGRGSVGTVDMSGVTVPTMDDPSGNSAADGASRTGQHTNRVPTPLDALQVMASSDVMLTPTLRHVEMYTMRGLLTLLWHEPAEGVAVQPGALVLCGGAMWSSRAWRRALSPTR